MKIVICGGRTFGDYNVFLDTMKKIDIGERKHKWSKRTPPIIISGHARGADNLGEVWARSKGYRVLVFPAKWNEYGKAAGPIRNQEMCNECDAVVAFWDGRSPGTKHMIKISKEADKKVLVFDYKGNLKDKLNWDIIHDEDY